MLPVGCNAPAMWSASCGVISAAQAVLRTKMFPRRAGSETSERPIPFAGRVHGGRSTATPKGWHTYSVHPGRARPCHMRARVKAHRQREIPRGDMGVCVEFVRSLGHLILSLSKDAGMSGWSAHPKSPHGERNRTTRAESASRANPVANQISPSATRATRLVSIQNPSGGKTA